MNSKKSPPKFFLRFFRWYCHPGILDYIEGDLMEVYGRRIKESGKVNADMRFAIDVILLFRPGIIRKTGYTNSINNGMIKSYFKTALRSLLAYKGTAAINILGLVVGIAASLVILTVVRFELSFDSFHSNADRIYRIVRVSGSDMSEFRTGVSYPVPQALKQEISTLQNITAIEHQGGATVDVMNAAGTSVKMFKEENGVVLADTSFFQIFDFKGTSFKWLAGNPQTALREPFSVVLTQSLAKKYFESDQALGQTLRFDKSVDCKVTGIVEDFPSNTDLPFTMLVSYSTLNKLANDMFNDWSSVGDSHQAFVLLMPGTTKEEMEAQIARVHAAHTPKDLHEDRHYLLQPLKDLHHEAHFGTFSGRTISRQTILALSIIGLFLLLTASINYINLSIAQSSLRAKEIGLRKVMGSNRGNLIFQLLAETLLVVSIAGILALGVAEILIINFHTLLNLTPNHYYFTDPFNLISLLIIVIVLSILSGLYPSRIISRINPIAAMKSKFSTETFAGLNLRKVLVVAQFTITQVLVVGTFIVVSQMNFFNKAEMGFNREAILNTGVADNNPAKLKVLEDQFQSLPAVERVSFSYTLPSGAYRSRSYRDVGRQDAAESKDYRIFEYQPIDPSYIELYGIKILEGRNLTYADSIGNVLINKTLMKNLGWTNPADAIGQPLKAYQHNYTVVGVVDDFYSKSLKQGIDNILMTINPDAYYTISIKLNTTDSESVTDAIAQIEHIWKQSFPDHIFDYQFFDENVAAFYSQEKKYAQLFQLFSVVFLLIGSLGLYGLIAFVVNRKGKEVAIRKTLGATTQNILLMFSREYVRLILVSFVLAVPVAWYLVNDWLNNFANRITLSWWLFLVPGACVLVLAILVICAKSLRTANANPVEKLKYE